MLSVDVYDQAGVQQTAIAGTVSVFSGSATVVDEAVVSVFGPPATYTLTAATTANEQTSDRWLVVWTLTIGGATHVFQRPASLVLRILDPVLIDADLVELHSDLEELRDPSQTSFEAQREAAWVQVNRWLIDKGNRPNLIVGSDALRDVHRYKTLEIIFRDWALSVGDGRYSELAETYRTLAQDAFDRTQLLYDRDESGQLNAGEDKPPTPVTFLSSSWGWRYGRGY